MLRARKPIFAAINGPIAGIGLCVVMFCDFRYMAEGQKLTTAFAERGILWRLPRWGWCRRCRWKAFARNTTENAAPRSIGIIKRQGCDSLFQDLDTAWRRAEEEMQRSFAGEDFRAGVAHFIDKRPPAFTGR